MANIRANGNGDWNTPATWVGGVVPTSADDVYANNFIVTIDVNITVLSLRNTVGTSITAGGHFAVTTSRSITANIIGGSVATANGVVLVTTAMTLTLVGSITAGSGSVGVVLGLASVLNHTGGNLLGGTGSGAPCVTVIGSSATATVNITGNVTGGTGVSSAGINTGSLFAGIITINGNVLAGSGSEGTTISANTTGRVVINGNVTGATAGAFSGVTVNGGVYTITGTVTGGSISTAYGVRIASGVNITVRIIGTCLGGTVTGATGLFISTSDTGTTVWVDLAKSSATSRGLQYTGSANNTHIILGGIEWHTGGFMPVEGIVRFVNDNTVKVTFTKSGGAAVTLRDTVLGGGTVPAISDVRNGIVYNSGALTGTLKVPSPTFVSVGVPTDNTVGSLSGGSVSGGDITSIANELQTLIVPELTVINNGVKNASILVPHTTNL